MMRVGDLPRVLTQAVMSFLRSTYPVPCPPRGYLLCSRHLPSPLSWMLAKYSLLAPFADQGMSDLSHHLANSRHCICICGTNFECINVMIS